MKEIWNKIKEFLNTPLFEPKLVLIPIPVKTNQGKPK